MHLRPGIIFSLTTTDPCLPIVAWKYNDLFCSWSSRLVPSNSIGQSFLLICRSPALWLCLKKCSKSRALVMLLQIGATDLAVNVTLDRIGELKCVFLAGQ